MPDSPHPKMSEALISLAATTVEEQQRLLEKQRLKTERKGLRRTERAAIFSAYVDRVKLTAAKQVYLKRYIFLTDEELTEKHKLTKQQIAVVRQWEQPKRNAAFSVESSSKLIEAETRGQADKKSVTLNVENMNVVQLPEKQEETIPPVYIDVSPEDKK